MKGVITMVYAKGKLFVCDTEEDVKDLPTDRSPGALAKIISNSSSYILNSYGEWIKQKTANSANIEELLQYIGNLEDLTTENKDNLVLSLNELNENIKKIINDTETSKNSTWSSENIAQNLNYINSRINNLDGTE